MADHDKSRRGQKPPASGGPDQSRRFIEAARELGADLPEEEFNEALRRLGRAPVRKDEKGKKPGKK